jgi:hypothetical protein
MVRWWVLIIVAMKMFRNAYNQLLTLNGAQKKSEDYINQYHMLPT